MILSLATLLIPILIIIAIVMAVRSKGAQVSGMEGVSMARHVWLYLLTLISLGILAAGVGQLLTLLFDVTIRSSYISSIGNRPFDLERLALGLAMMLISGPLWFLFWNGARRRIIQNPAEGDSIIRKLFLSLVILVAALIFLPTLASVFRWLLSGAKAESFSSSNLATVIVTGIIWFYHWRVSKREGFSSPAARTIQRWYIYILSGFGLVWLASGTIVFVTVAAESLPFWKDSFIGSSFWNDAIITAITQIVLGGATWYFHWFRMAKADVESALRQVYFYLLAITGGAVLTLVAATLFFYKTFYWFFGAANVSAGEHFQFLCWTVPSILVGIAIWLYHRSLAQEEAGKAEEKRESARRVYIYLVNFLGLGTSVAGVVMLFGILLSFIINALSTSLTPAPGWWRDQLAISLALLLVGLPLLLYYWNIALKRAHIEALVEWRSLARRIFLYTAIGIAIIALTAGLVNIVYQLISGVLDSTSSVNILRNSRWSLQAILAAAPVLIYFWQVLKSDQRRGSETVLAQKEVTLLAFDPGRNLSQALQKQLGYKIRLLQLEAGPYETVPRLTEEGIALLSMDIQSSLGDKLMVVVTGDKTQILPYRAD